MRPQTMKQDVRNDESNFENVTRKNRSGKTAYNVDSDGNSVDGTGRTINGSGKLINGRNRINGQDGRNVVDRDSQDGQDGLSAKEIAHDIRSARTDAHGRLHNPKVYQKAEEYVTIQDALDEVKNAFNNNNRVELKTAINELEKSIEHLY